MLLTLSLGTGRWVVKFWPWSRGPGDDLKIVEVKLFAANFASQVEAIYIPLSNFLFLVRRSILFISCIFHLQLCEKWLFHPISAWKIHLLSFILHFKHIKPYTSLSIFLLQLISKVQNPRSVNFGFSFTYFFFSFMDRYLVVYFLLNKHISMFIRYIYFIQGIFFFFFISCLFIVRFFSYFSYG